MNAVQRCTSLLMFLGLGIVATSAQAATGVGPYYATPSWDQTIPAATRFLVLTNMNSEAVLDRETGLVWEKEPSTTEVAWFIAGQHCLTLNKGGRTGWRLPALPEIMSLVDRSQSNPALPSGHPFTVQPSTYWSATTFANNIAFAWIVLLDDGFVIGNNKSIESNDRNRAWCVRGGPGGDTQ